MSLATPRATRPALLVYSFVPAEQPLPEAGQSTPQLKQASAALNYLRDLWSACKRLEMTEPVENLGIDFPDSVPYRPTFRLLAARRKPVDGPEIWSAFLFAEHDVIGLVAVLAPNEPGNGLEYWRDLDERWCENAPPLSSLPANTILGEALLFVALTEEESADIPERFRDALRQSLPLRTLPIAATDSWSDSYVLTDQGFTVWEAPRYSHERRRICILAPLDKERDLDAWVWTSGIRELPPFTRYLLHSAKVDFELRAYRSWRFGEDCVDYLRWVRREVEDTLDELVSLNQELDAETRISPTSLINAQSRLTLQRTQSTGLIAMCSQLRELRRSVRIAQANFTAQIPVPMRQGTGESIFDRDLASARWLQRQVDDDLVYLQAVRERAHEVQKFTAARVSQAVQLRHDRLTLLQTSVIGGLIMGLTVIKALETYVPLPLALHWPVIAVLAALAFALPPALWLGMGDYKTERVGYRLTYLAVAVLGTTVCWFLVAVLWWQIWETSAPLAVSAGAAALGGVLFALLTQRVVRRWVSSGREDRQG